MSFLSVSFSRPSTFLASTLKASQGRQPPAARFRLWMAPAAADPAAASSHPPHPVGTPKYLSTQPLAASYDPAHCQQPQLQPAAPAGLAAGPSSRRAAGGTTSLPGPPPSLRHLSPSMIAGAGAGLVSSIVTCPLDVVKTRMQAQTKGKGKAVAYDSALSESPFFSPCSALAGLGRPWTRAG